MSRYGVKNLVEVRVHRDERGITVDDKTELVVSYRPKGPCSLCDSPGPMLIDMDDDFQLCESCSRRALAVGIAGLATVEEKGTLHLLPFGVGARSARRRRIQL